MKTQRQQIIELLKRNELSAREISASLGIEEKDVYVHLTHIERSVAARGKKIHIRASRCRKCGYIFIDRRRFTRPGRCPRCKASYIEEPAFKIL